MSARHGGRRAGAGRPKGSIAKFNADLKLLILGALEDVGGREYLARQAVETPTAFLALLAKVLPTQLAGHDGGKLEVEFRWRDDPQPVINGIATDVDTKIVDTVPDDDPAATTFIGEC